MFCLYKMTTFVENSVFIIILGCLLLANVKAENDDNKQETQALGCGSYGDCLSTPIDCDSKCGCDDAYFYNDTTQQCQLNIQHLMKALLVIYDPVDPNSDNDSGMAAYIRRQSIKVFRGIIVAAILFGTCALVCVITACFYCCKINYSDRSLKGNVKALAKKMHRDQKFKKPAKIPPKAEAQSCNVMVEDAAVTKVGIPLRTQSTPV